MKETNDMIDKLFNQLDNWRHLPSYQLERRADIFFSLYLKDIIKNKFGFDVKDDFIPEFPIRKGLLYKNFENDKKNRNRSYKIDYVAISVNSEKAVLIELKTESRSINPKQNTYLEKSREKGLPFLLQGVIQLFNQKNSSKKKYLCLLKKLASIGQITLDPKLMELSTDDAINFIKENPDSINKLDTVKETFLLYIQPTNKNYDESSHKKIVTFNYLRDFINNNTNDALSSRFADSLLEWNKCNAGDTPIN